MKKNRLFHNIEEAGPYFETFINEKKRDKIVVLCDNNTLTTCYPCFAKILPKDHSIIAIPPGDNNKTLSVASFIWQRMRTLGVTRGSLLINLGGGMITDIGGFCGSLYMRGLDVVNVPTSLLGMVDAAHGGKVAVNEGGIKNSIGLIRQAECFIITSFLKTLPIRELISGNGEVYKYKLLSAFTGHPTELISSTDIGSNSTLKAILNCIEAKEGLTESDVNDNGIRRYLNLGHTIGHAIESYSLESDPIIPHGYAVAWGLIYELKISTEILGYSGLNYTHHKEVILKTFGRPPKIDVDVLLDYMKLDKKNSSDSKISMVLLNDKGMPKLENNISPDVIRRACETF